MRTRILFTIGLISLLMLLTGCPSIPVREEPYPTDFHFREAESQYLLGNYEQAIRHYETFIKTQAETIYRTEAHYRLGVCHLKIGNYDKAIEVLSLALNERHYPALRAQILSARGWTYLIKREYSAAVRDYKKALAIPANGLPEDKTIFDLATALVRMGEWAEGADYFNRLINDYPQSDYAERAQERLALPPRTFVVQLGVYHNKENAEQDLKSIQEKGVNASIKFLFIGGQSYYFLWGRQFPSWQEALRQVNEIQAKGVEAIVVP